MHTFFRIGSSRSIARSRRLAAFAVIILAVQASDRAWGQWSGTSPITTTSNVGIGTPTPAAKLHVSGLAPLVRLSGTGANWSGIQFENTALATPVRWALYNGAGGQGGDAISFFDYTTLTDRLTLAASGNVGIGTTTPQELLHVVNGAAQNLSLWAQNANTSYNAGLRLTSARDWQLMAGGTLSAIPSKFGLWDGNAAAYRLVVDTAGNVGIGTTAPQSKLAVNGTITTKEVVVTTTGWADYVLKPGYRLASLRDTAAHIKEHGTLPGIPSETEVKQKGVGVGELQVKLLAKIEELTLHMIQEHDRNNRLEQQNHQLQERLAKLEASALAHK